MQIPFEFDPPKKDEDPSLKSKESDLSDTDVQKSIAAFASLSLNTSNTSSMRAPSSDTVVAEEETLESAETEDAFPRSADTEDADVSKPSLDCFAGRNFVAETNDVFLWKNIYGLSMDESDIQIYQNLYQFF